MNLFVRMGKAAVDIGRRLSRSRQQNQAVKAQPPKPQKKAQAKAQKEAEMAQQKDKQAAMAKADSMKKELKQNNMAVKGKDVKTNDPPPPTEKDNGNSSSGSNYRRPPQYSGRPKGKTRGKERSR